jgi:hypothetical protein
VHGEATPAHDAQACGATPCVKGMRPAKRARHTPLWEGRRGELSVASAGVVWGYEIIARASWRWRGETFTGCPSALPIAASIAHHRGVSFPAVTPSAPPPAAHTPPLPHAPSQAVWDAMTPAQRAALVDALPTRLPRPLGAESEGDDHVDAAVGTRDTLRMLYQRSGRKVYIGAGASVFYPEVEAFAPEVIAVNDVEDHNRTRWVVSAEGKGVDLALEVLVAGDRRKDLERNVVRYASLGIREYFVFDRRRRQLHGHRLDAPALRTYSPITPHAGRLASQVLGLDLIVQGSRLRFYHGTAMVLANDEIIHKLEETVEEMAFGREEAEMRAEAERQRADIAEQRVAELLAEIERLRSR